jgi:hypothetical protein
MDYQTFVTQEFLPRAQSAFNSIRAALILAGVPANRITVSVPDTTDLRVQFEATRAGQTITGFIELTDATHLGMPNESGKAIITMFVTDGTNEVTHSYVAGNIRSYLAEADIDLLLAKLSELEAEIPALAVKIRARLGL